jgi:tight adherence protein B
MQAVGLSILPVVAFVALFFLNRGYAQILLDHPRLLVGILVADVVGAFWIRRIINFDF